MKPTQGSNVLGKAGGPADITLESNSLSRRHALIVVGTRAEQCTVEDLGSTNKSHIMAEDTGGDAQTLEPGMVYPLRACVQLVFGDVRAEFEFMRGPHTAATASSGGEGKRNAQPNRDRVCSRENVTNGLNIFRFFFSNPTC